MPEEPRQAEVVDLMERLRQSLQGAGKTGAKSRKPAKARKTAGRTSKKRRAA
jgi:non-homologous end joining protein Ku